MTNAFNLSQLANNTNSSGQVTLTTGVVGTLPVANGGLGTANPTLNNVLIGGGTNPITGVAAGTSGNVLTSNGTTWASAAAAGGGFSNMVAYTTAGTATWTLPAGVSKARVTLVGGGGNGGAGSNIANNAIASSGAPASAGGASIMIMNVTAPVSYTVGAAGGTSSFGPTPSGTISATGGAAGGAGGLGSGGTLNLRGGPYLPSSYGGSSGARDPSAGGNSIFCGGGAPGRGAGLNGGGGASGPGPAAGGAGGVGVVMIEY